MDYQQFTEQELAQLVVKFSRLQIFLDFLVTEKIPNLEARLEALEKNGNPMTPSRGVNRSGYGYYLMQVMQEHPEGLHIDQLVKLCQKLYEANEGIFNLTSFNSSLNKNIREYKTLTRDGKMIYLN